MAGRCQGVLELLATHKQRHASCIPLPLTAPAPPSPPATPVQEMKLLADRQVQIVDTTCPWVSKVWNAVDNQSRKVGPHH